MPMPSPYAEGNCYKCNRSLARTKNSKKGKRNLSQPTTYFQATHSFTRGVFISTLLSQQDLQKKAEWDCRNAGSIYSWKTLWEIFYKEGKKKKKDLMGDVLDWAMFCFHWALRAARPAGKVREPHSVCCCSKMPGAMAKVHFPPKEPWQTGVNERFLSATCMPCFLIGTASSSRTAEVRERAAMPFQKNLWKGLLRFVFLSIILGHELLGGEEAAFTCL